MRVKKYLGIAILISAALSLTGCGESFPELTQEEYDQTVEFAVGLLMKYSNNGQAKLTYVDVKEEVKQRAKEEAKKAKEEAVQEATKEPEKEISLPEPTETSQTPSTAEASTTDSSADEDSGKIGSSETVTPATEASTDETTSDASSDSQNSSVKEDPDAIVLSSEDTQEVMDDIFLSYQGYSVSSSYPESSKSYVINADKGKKLLVLRFDLYNASDSDKNVNLLSKNIMFQVILNGKNLGYTAVTFLPNDLSSYVGTIDSRAHESLVVLTEIGTEESTQIQTLGLIVTINGNDQKVTLK